MIRIGCIDQVLRADSDTSSKQRHTAERTFDRLVTPEGAVDVSYSMVRGYVAERRRGVWAEADRGPTRAFVLQSYRPGAEADVDFRADGIPTLGLLRTLNRPVSTCPRHGHPASSGAR